MKRLFRALFIFIFLIIAIVGGVVGYFYFTIASNVDEAPLDLYTDEVTLNSEIYNLLYSALEKAEESDELLLAVDEDQLNKLIFAIIKDSINPDYKKEDCETDECQYILSETEMDPTIPVIGGRNILVKHAYSKMSTNNEISLIVTMNVFGIDTNVNTTLRFTESEGEYKLELIRLALGKLNLVGGVGRFLLQQGMTMTGFGESFINSKIQELGIPVTFKAVDLSFRFTKSDIAGMLIQDEGTSDDPSTVFVNELVGLLLDDESGLLDIGFYEKNEKIAFGLKLDFSNLKYDATTDGIPPYALDFDLFKTRMTTLDTEDILTEENHAAISAFLLFGYADLSAEDKVIIDGLSFASIGIASPATYMGMGFNQTYADLDLAEYMSDQLYSGIADLSVGYLNILIEETIINQILYNTGLLGTGFNLYSKTATDKIIYSGIEALWMDIQDDDIGLKMIYNLNGTRLVLYTSFADVSTDEMVIDAEFDQLRLGTIEFSEEFKAAMMDMIASSFEADGLSLIEITESSIVIDGNTFLEDFENEATLSALIDLLQSENQLSLSLVGANLAANGAIRFQMNLEMLEITTAEAELPDGVDQPFDQNLFITNKTQTLLISNLADPKQPKIVITEREFNQMIYSNTNGYQDFTSSQTLPDGTTTFDTEVLGLLFEFTPTVVTIKVVMNMNGLITAIYLPGAVQDNDTDEVKIVLDDEITIGGQGLTTSSDFILDIIGDSLDDMSVISYDPVTKTMSITANSFAQMMAFGGTTPLVVEKIKIVDGGIENYVSMDDPILTAVFDALTTNFEQTFTANFMTVGLYGVVVEGQNTAVPGLDNELTTFVGIVNSVNDLVHGDTDRLIIAINALNDANQELFFEELETASDSSGGLFTLSDFYGLLFQ